MLKLTTDKHEASRGLSATAELLGFTIGFFLTGTKIAIFDQYLALESMTGGVSSNQFRTWSNL